MFNISLKNLLYLLTIFSCFALISAYFIEHILGHQPCNLCLIERIPYFVSIFLIILFFIFRNYQKLILFFIFITFVFASLVSFYHVGIEQGFFDESLVCKINDITQNLSKEELLKMLTKNPISCKNVTFRFFGMSLATINTLISLAFSAIILIKYQNYEKN
jgi:disulfide bond formation protein DsbB